jgi:hypothetical protein
MVVANDGEHNTSPWLEFPVCNSISVDRNRFCQWYFLELEATKRSAKAAEQAALNVAEQRERERTLFQQRALEASRKATERGLQILKESAKGSKPSDAARLLAVGDAIGRAALGLGSGGASLGDGRFPNPVAAPVITVIHQEGDALRAARADTRRFIAEHPDHPIVRKYLAARARGLPPQFGETDDRDSGLRRR